MNNNIAFADYLFRSKRMAFFWTLIRLYIGFIWVNSFLGKIVNPAWIGENKGAALSGFVSRALTKAEGPRPDVQSWYAYFLENVVLPNAEIFSYLVVFGELLVGLALILGALVGIAAFFGAFMNMSFLLAGAVSINPIMLILSIGLMLAWRTAGHFGLDRKILPLRRKRSESPNL
jgi:thiosulfate dehydrogenase (quinone) large subunit